MIFDIQTLLADSQAITGNAASTTSSTNIIDMNGGITTVPGSAGVGPTGYAIGGPLAHNIFQGKRPEVYIQIEVAPLASGGAMEVQFDLFVNDTANNTTPTVIGSTGAIAKASLTPGTVIRLTADRPVAVTDRYLGINYTVTTNNITTDGAFTAGIVLDAQSVHL